MRAIHLTSISVLVAVPLAWNFVGCSSVSCEDQANCGPYVPPDAASGSAGAAGGSGGTGSGGSGGAGVDDGGNSDVDGSPVCDPTKTPGQDPCVVNDKYGVFVSPSGSDTAGLGTKSAPFKTLGKGLASAKTASKRLYACDDGTGYTEQVTIDASLDGVTAFGGFKCDWSYATTNRAAVRPPTSPALLTKSLVVGATLENFEFDAPDATTAGASSLGAMLDTTANLTLRRVKIVAGKGAPGQVGINGAKGDDGLAVAVQQQGLPAVCPWSFPTPTQAGGFWPGPICDSQGGNGGTAIKGNQGSPGSPGLPHVNDNGGTVGGGDGRPGAIGGSGMPGAVTMASGAFSATGYAPAAAAGDGTDGVSGQAGGGGGASNATDLCIGASGGAGGMGGCGGKAGKGGGGGGASIALLSWTSTNLTLDTCELVAKDGGTGGKGGNGGLGGIGKDGADGGAAYSGDAGSAVGKGGHGGIGGNGGAGGPGAGGNGGPSYTLAYKGQAATKPQTTLTPGPGGAKGAGGISMVSSADGGTGTLSASDGTAGQSAQEFAVP